MFKNRIQAGEILADKLAALNLDKPYLLAIPRGGIVIAEPIAKKLSLSVGVLITRKIGHPLNPEVAIGAVMPDGSAILDETAADRLGLDDNRLRELITEQYQEIKRRLLAYTGTERIPNVSSKTIVLIDDGIATGYTIYAAVKWLKSLNPGKIIIAVPVAPPDVVANLTDQVDAVICPIQPYDFMAVGQYYQDFSQTSDQEVVDILTELGN
ncbi:putative phosphoribosyl transferase [bioreactor metagenome]|uniref:Putative phosphoribosyl transferase n=1 Tax=bioreactor metagenome TaxID=1076179 RepID=A0A645D0H9_9ZZZZ